MHDVDHLLESLRETRLRVQHEGAQRATPNIDDTAERTRAALRLLARSRIAAILRQLRAATGLSYEEVQLQSGISQQALYDIEFKDRRITLDELRRLAECYGVTVSDVAGVDLE